MHCIENCPVQKGCPWFFSLLVLFSAKLCLYTAILLQALKNIETLWPIHTLSQSFFLLFGVSAKMYIPSTIKTQIIILMTGANNNGGSWVIWRHGKIICYCLGPWYMNIVPSFFCADLGLQGRTAIFLKVSYFWELDFLQSTQS